MIGTETHKPMKARPPERAPRPRTISEEELARPRVATVFKLIWNTIVRVFHDPVAILIGSAFLVLMVWGPHGDLELLGAVWEGWQGPGSDPATRTSIIDGIPWDQEWISFWAGLFLVVLVPMMLIKFVFKQDLRDYGLGGPKPGRWPLALLSGVILLALSLPAFYLGAQDEGMRSIYPFFRGDFDGLGQFALYQLGYLPFFICIEFIFRGYLLFGLYNVKDTQVAPAIDGERGPLVFGYYAILLSMLSYTAWHLGKPLPELWGTLIWGIAAGAIVLATGTIWIVTAVHWLLNVLLDYLIVFG